MSLLNPILVKTGILSDIHLPDGIEWFKDIDMRAFFKNIILPFIFIVLIALFLRHRYNNKLSRSNKEIIELLKSDAIEPYMIE